MSRGATRTLILVFSCLAICLAFVPAAGALTINDCTPYNVPANQHVVIVGDPNVVLACGILAQDVTIKAPGSITVTSLGAITTTGTAGMHLLAGLDSKGNKCLDPLNATNSFIDIQGAQLTDLNSNGGIVLKSCWDITFETGSFVTSANSGGGADNIRVQCLEPTVAPATSPWGCQVKVDHSAFSGNRILMFSQGDMTLICSTFDTVGPRDQQTYESLFGNLFAGEVCSLDGGSPAPLQPIACQTVIDLVNGNCVNGFIDSAILCTLCQEQPVCCHNEFSGGVESNAFFFAEQEVDLSAACVNIAENITITADGRFPTSPYALTGGGVGPGGAYYINLERAEIRDDFGKTGFINITAVPPMDHGKPVTPGNVPFSPPGAGYGCSTTWFGIGDIWYEGAILVDDGANGGGVDPKAVSYMNGCRVPVAGNCGAVTPTCTNRAIPARGWVADPASRLLHHVIGTPRCDS